MKQQQYSIIFSLIMAITGLSPVMAADAGQTINPQPVHNHHNSHPRYTLTTEQLDSIAAGRWFDRGMMREYHISLALLMDCNIGQGCSAAWMTMLQDTMDWAYQEGNDDAVIITDDP